MSDSLDDLLSSCSLASRAVRLLTAEAKRRAILLKACCSEYEIALDRLSDARRHSSREESQHKGDEAEADVRRPGSSGQPTRRQEAGQSRSQALHHAKPYGSEAASAAAAGPVNFRESSPELTAAIGSATIKGPIPDNLAPSSSRNGGLLVSNCFGMSEDSSRITKSLEEILEQARSIRSSNSSKEIWGSAPSRERKTGASGSISSGPGKAASSRGGKGQRTASSGSGVGGVAMSTRTATPRTASRSSTGTKAKPAGSASSALHGHQKRRSSTGTAHRGTSQPDGVSAQGSTSSSRRGGETVTHRSEAGPTLKEGSQSAAMRSQRSGSLGNERPKVGAAASEPAASAAAADVVANLESGMWEEIARYQAARGRFMAKNGVSSSSNSSGSFGDAGTSSHEDFHAAEEAMLRGLEGAGSASSGNDDRCPESRYGPQPDPAFLEWRQRLLSQLHCERAGITHPRDPDSQGRLDVGSIDGTKHGECRKLRGREAEAQGTLEEVERLQRSLLMLLDEVEGRREVIAQDNLRRKRTESAKCWVGGDGTRQGQGQGGSGEEDPARILREFEDWYSWNMVVHVTGLLRERLDEIARHDACVRRDSLSLSKQAERLIEKPSLSLSGENPLRVLSRLDGDSAWRDGWRQSSGVQQLRGTACLALVDDLQESVPSWWSRDSASTGEHAEHFGQQLRATCMFAAEADISRIVVPALARELSHGCRQKRSPDPAPRDPYEHIHRPLLGKTATTTKTPRGYMGGVEDKGLRYELQRRPMSGSQLVSGGLDAAGKQEETLWAPGLAVFRAVDAVLSGGGRPRMSFVRRTASSRAVDTG